MKTGVLLFNLGGPESLQDVRPFLYNLFSDPEIIRIKSNSLRRLLAWLIAIVRQGKSRDLYRQIGGGSPLRRITEEQAAALNTALNERGFDSRVYVAMRCWKPGIDEAVDQIIRDGIDNLVLLPLFPQYSLTTTGSCLKYFQGLADKLRLSSKMRISTIESWCDDPLYVDVMEQLIRESLDRFSLVHSTPIHLLYSAHSIPARYVTEEGDPYLKQTERSVARINDRLGNAYPWTLAFQSKVGPVRWLEPSSMQVLCELGRIRTTGVLVIPISFVSDHIETLQEIDIAYRNLALKSGIREFHRVPAPNTDPRFIHALASLVLNSNPEIQTPPLRGEKE